MVQTLTCSGSSMTVAAAIIAIFVLPNFPRTTRWLTDDERALAVWRLDEDIGEDDWIDSKHQTFWHGFKLACADIKMWIMVRQLFISPRVANHMLTCLDTHAPWIRILQFNNQLFPHRGEDARI